MNELLNKFMISSLYVVSTTCYSSKVSTTTTTVGTLQPPLTMITTMPAHVWLPVSATPTFPSLEIALETCNNTSTKFFTLASGTDPRPDISEKGTRPIKPEWVATFLAMIVFLVVIIIVLVLIVIKLAKANQQATELPSETNYYDEIQISGKLNNL